MFVRRFCVYSFFLILLLFSICLGDSNLLFNPDFEDSSGWAGRSCTLNYSTNNPHGGSFSGLASGRTATWQGIQQSLLGRLQDGNSCTISGWVKLDNAASDVAKISIEKTIDGITSWDSITSNVPVNNSGWTFLSGNYTLHVMGNLTALRVYFEGPASGVNFYVDDANVAVNFDIPVPPPVDYSAKVQQVWAKTQSGSAAGSDYVQDIELDSSGNVYVTGYAKNSATGYDLATIKYSPDGTSLWTNTYNVPGSYADYAVAMDIDLNSDIIVAGCSDSASGYDGVIVKYNSAGLQLWSKQYNSAADDELFYDVATDAAGNIYAVGEINEDCLIVKFTSQGNLVWARTYGSVNGYDALYRLALDAAGNVYACGESTGTGNNQDCLTIKYSNAGALLWAKTFNGSANGWDILEAIVLDSSGNAYVTGSVETATDSDYITMKYSSAGDLIWNSAYTGTSSGWDESYAIALTSDNNIAVTGYSQNETNGDAATVKYNSQTGAQIWAARYNSIDDSTDCSEAITADDAGNIYIAGRSYQGGSLDFLTICYASNGTELWKMNYNGPASKMDIASAIAVSGDDVYVAGRCADSAEKFDYAVVKYAPFSAQGQADAITRYQTLNGFGASNVWSGNGLVALLSNRPEIRDILFGQLGIDILRLRNTYQYEDYYINNCAITVAAANASLGHPIQIMISAWSPPGSLKSNGSASGGTLARDQFGNYRYNDYVQWWYDSINAFTAQGMRPDFLNMQNEPDWIEWCQFSPTETPALAGYKQAFKAFYAKINTMPIRPKILAPEGAGMTNARTFIGALDETDKSNIYGWSHHLYNTPDGGDAYHPDGFIPVMNRFAADFNDKPRLQTEYAKLDSNNLTFSDAINLAKLIHNSMVYDQASAYLYWELTWSPPKGLVSITNTTYTINPVYYAFKHFSAFTDPNWQRIKTTINNPDVRASAYISPNNNKLSIVIINDSNNYISLNLNSIIGYNASSGSIYRTSRTENCVLIGPYEDGMPLSLPGNSIITVALSGNAATCPNRPAGDLNGDCMVDFLDIIALGNAYTGSQANHISLKNIAETWLQCGFQDPADCWQ